MSDTEFAEKLLWWLPQDTRRDLTMLFMVLREVDDRKHATHQLNIATRRWDTPRVNGEGATDELITMQPMHRPTFDLYQPVLLALDGAYKRLEQSAHEHEHAAAAAPVSAVEVEAEEMMRNVLQAAGANVDAEALQDGWDDAKQTLAAFLRAQRLDGQGALPQSQRLSRVQQLAELQQLQREATGKIRLGQNLTWRFDENPSEARDYSALRARHAAQRTPSPSASSGSAVSGGCGDASDQQEWPAFDLTALVWPQALDVTVHVHRDWEPERTFRVEPDVPEGITYGQLLRTLHAFLNTTPLSAEDLRENFEVLDDDDRPVPLEQVHEDDFDAYRLEQLRKTARGEPVFWIDQMGDAVHFEGIVIDPRDNTAYIATGS